MKRCSTPRAAPPGSSSPPNKHILAANRDEHGQSTLTPDDRGRLADNVVGYDISPDMVRLSLVNLYLHGFADPRIHEYDTLTSEERWSQHADVILANPPFMSPKGGIRPHNHFSVQSKRSEVLFVDYMAEHLTPAGRAGIIVPEGIIFQSQKAHTRLRHMLVEDSLVAVVSLPAGVFKPYSGVKTSILILDRALARRADHIAFFKVENDGFDLGDQRRPIDKNDLPQVQAELTEYLRRVRVGESLDDFQPSLGLVVVKKRIAADGDYNLSGERYREANIEDSEYEWAQLGEIVLEKPQYGSGARKVPYDGNVRYVRITDLTDNGELKPDDQVSPSAIEPDRFLQSGDLLIARSGSVGRTYIHDNELGTYQYAGYLIRFRIDPTKAIPKYIYHITKSESWRKWILSNSKTGTLTNINAKQYSSFRFPLPPLEVQQEIVAEVEGYQKVIDGARAVIDNYRPHIPIDPEWPMVSLGKLLKASSGGTPSRRTSTYYLGGNIPWLKSGEINQKTLLYSEEHITDSGLENSSAKIFPAGTVLVAMYGATAGKVGLLKIDAATNQAVCGILPSNSMIPEFLFYYLGGQERELIRFRVGGAQPNISQGIIRSLPVPFPPIAAQESVVAAIEAEQALVAGNRELVDRFERKIQAAIARVWGSGA